MVLLLSLLTLGLGTQRDFDLAKPRSLKKSLIEPRCDICSTASHYHYWPLKPFSFSLFKSFGRVVITVHMLSTLLLRTKQTLFRENRGRY